MARTREVFEASTDFTLAIEEEFQILDGDTLSLTQRFTDLKAAAQQDPVLAAAIAGEGLEVKHLPSGAGHDGMALIAIAPIGMLFVRCAGGISHRGGETS